MNKIGIILAFCISAGCGRTREPVPKPEFDTETYCFNGTSIVSKDGRWGIADTSGNIVLPLRYDNVAYVTDEIAAASEGTLRYLIDRGGNVIAETVSDTMLSDEALMDWAEEVSAGIREKWDRVLDSYAELARLCSASGTDKDSITSKAGEIREMLEEISGSMSRDQLSRFEMIRGSKTGKGQ